jgi:methionyl-tRNA formyltransferase
MTPQPVKEAALEAGLHTYQPEKIRSDAAYDFFTRLVPDVVVIIAYGQIIPARLLEIPRLGWINVHASLLPRYRGAAPVNWAILNGETRTGLTTMRIDPGLDTGPTLLRWETEIGPEETAPQLARRLAEAGAPLIVETLRKLERGEISPAPQDHTQATHAPPLKKEDGKIDWSQAAQQIYNRIRGLDPWPGAFTSFRGQLCHISGQPREGAASSDPPGTISASGSDLSVTCGGGSSLRIEAVQLEGRKRVTAREFLNGARLESGERFGV